MNTRWFSRNVRPSLKLVSVAECIPTDGLSCVALCVDLLRRKARRWTVADVIGYLLPTFWALCVGVTSALRIDSHVRIVSYSIGEAIRLRRRDWVPTFTELLYRQSLILVPPNHSMQRKIDPGLRLATPSLSPASISADFNVRRRR